MGIEQLWAAAAITPYDDSSGLLAELRSWANSSDGLAVAAVVGDGGMGKTRLAIELCRQLGGQGWVCGMLRTERDTVGSEFTDRPALTRLASFKRPRLIVIDYADSRPSLVRIVVEAVAERWPPTRYRTRIVLLAAERSATTPAKVAPINCCEAPRPTSSSHHSSANAPDREEPLPNDSVGAPDLLARLRAAEHSNRRGRRGLNGRHR